ncbi:MAG TPA: sulfate permease [Gemmatales bacterium]|nr:sulfate permease [Gemmatales bacterium]
MFIPKTFTVLRGYSLKQFGADLSAGVIVGVVALPLAMAFAIGSGVGPERGLYTAIIAGFLISFLGGSRVQIGGPTGAFIPIVAGIVLAPKLGYDGLAMATLMAGVLLIIMGVSRVGAAIKFIPYPVTAGFTTGIAVIIFTGQINDFLGLGLTQLPAEFLGKASAYAGHLNAVHAPTVGLAALSLLILLVWPRLRVRIPGPLVVMLFATGLVAGLKTLFGDVGIETIADRFGAIPSSLPAPAWPAFDWGDHWQDRLKELMAPALTIALLAGIESLLSAVVADGMIGGRHRPNIELVAQGVANIASPLFGGIPATGAIARTATNVKSGGRTPVAGMIHALTLLVIMLALAPYAGHIPLCALAAILVMVAWNMAEIESFKALLRAPKSDAAIMLVTFGLTVLIDLTVAVPVGLVLACLLFIKRMADVTNVQAVTREFSDAGDGTEDPNAIEQRRKPPGVEVYEVNGPFFFGAADKLRDVLGTVGTKEKRVFILRMRHVPAMDATGLFALEELRRKCERDGQTLILSEIHTQPMLALGKAGGSERFGWESTVGHIDDALNRAREWLGTPREPPDPGRFPEVERERQPPSATKE